MSSEPPVANGSLAETPFAHLMLYLYRKAGAGTLHVRSGSGAEVLIRVQNGRPMAARTSEGGSSLLHALLPACGFQSGDFVFYAGDHMATVEGPLASCPMIEGSLDPYALLYASLREHARDDMVDGVLSRYPDAKLALPPDRDVTRLGIDETDQAIIDALRMKPASVDEILMSSPLPGLHTRRVLYALLVTHMLAPQESRATDSYKSQVDQDPPTTPQAPPPTRTTLSGAHKMPVGPDGKPAAAPRVIMQRPAAATVNEVASASMPAWQQLISMRPPGAAAEPRRLGDNQSLRPPSPPRGSLAPGANANDPASRRRRVELCMQTSRYAEALPLLEELLKEAPDAKLQGLRARALFEVHKNDRHGLPRTVIEAVKKAHELDPDEANAFFVRGLIFKQAGDAHKALACWKRALFTDPKHIDAQREIRLANMREK
jgi:tetratricopeptide (TPR) repeat protein